MSTDRIWELMARKLAEEASPAELQELEHLLRVNPDLHLSVQTITDLWQHRREWPTNAAMLEDAWHKHISRMEQQGISLGHPEEAATNTTFLLEGNRHPLRRRYMLWAAAGILLIATIWYIFSLSVKPAASPELAVTEAEPVSEISTKNGSKTRIHLPDGSQVWLNAGSKLTYNKKYGTGLREVTLTGEAFFDVVKNPEVPFIIHTARIDVKVLGTTFNVKSYSGEKTTEASLLKGSIEVSFRDRPEKIILKPNEKIIVRGDSTQASPSSTVEKKKEGPEMLVAIKHLTYQEKDSAIVETAWVQNKLVFKDESFTELALKMERWYGVSIQFTDTTVESTRFTGTFESESIQQALRALKITAAFNYKFKDNKTIIISK